MSSNTFWISPYGHIIKCDKHHVDTLVVISDQTLGTREDIILDCIEKGYIRISFINDKWLIQVNEFTSKERRFITYWASDRKNNRTVAVEILKGSYKKIQTNIVELVDGVNISKRKVLKAAYTAPRINSTW